MTGLHWQPRRQSSLEVKFGREKKEAGKGQKVDWTRGGQRGERTAREEQAAKESMVVKKIKDKKGRRMLAKGENIVVFQGMLAEKKITCQMKIGWRQS